MRVKQVRVAQALRGETSNLLESSKYDLTFDKGMLHVKLKHNPKNIGPFIVFPANIAYLEYEEISEEASQVAAPEVTQPEAPKPSKRASSSKK